MTENIHFKVSFDLAIQNKSFKESGQRNMNIYIYCIDTVSILYRYCPVTISILHRYIIKARPQNNNKKHKQDQQNKAKNRHILNLVFFMIEHLNRDKDT